MQADDLIWIQCQHGFCSFKTKACTGNFCRNRNNVMGECRRLYCPLANSVYATIREFGGNVYLFTKSIERAHTPAKLWNKLLLDKDYMKALQQVTDTLTDEYNPKLVHRVKQRLTKVYQYLERERKLTQSKDRMMERVNIREERRDITRAEKAERMAKLDFVIKDQLLQRMKDGVYDDLYENLQELEQNPQQVELNEEEIEKELENELVQYEEDMSEDVEDWAERYKQNKTSDEKLEYPQIKKGPKVNIEFEEEPADENIEHNEN
ncbi:hypothetical protein ENUP19_0259G0046 [Entamoeba nuttalli]|uniref:Protein MAK16 homolog n=2 Tax=Entamoeba nuttalli TaxID=412467 RepID=K2HNT5_ENTNP|nr:MAK16 protein, putative [Entamoeba nuttalli P19]EKE37520.1 MAK16 protein, putative [Entamoeba nuttalli P19]|eukprot:XP_008860146.1 MAK16 protein, putative [Entamoeba nuttalli P19]